MFTSAAKDQSNRKLRNASKAAIEANGADLDSTIHAMGKDVRDFIETAIDTASDSLSQAKEKISDTTDNVTHRIKKNPLSSAMIAMGIGVALGAFLRRR